MLIACIVHDLTKGLLAICGTAWSWICVISSSSRPLSIVNVRLRCVLEPRLIRHRVLDFLADLATALKPILALHLMGLGNKDFFRIGRSMLPYAYITQHTGVQYKSEPNHSDAGSGIYSMAFEDVWNGAIEHRWDGLGLRKRSRRGNLSRSA